MRVKYHITAMYRNIHITHRVPPPKHLLTTPIANKRNKFKPSGATPRKNPNSMTTPRALRRRIVISSSDSESDSKPSPLCSVQQSLLTPKRVFKDTVIILTDSSDDELHNHNVVSKKLPGKTPSLELAVPCPEHDEWALDESILVL